MLKNPSSVRTQFRLAGQACAARRKSGSSSRLSQICDIEPGQTTVEIGKLLMSDSSLATQKSECLLRAFGFIPPYGLCVAVGS